MQNPASPLLFEELKSRLSAANDERAKLEVIGDVIATYLPFIRLLAGSHLDRKSRSFVDSEDIRQSISFRIAERLQDGRLELLSEGEFKALLRTMVRNLVLDKQRRSSPVPIAGLKGSDEMDPAAELPEDADSPSREIASEDSVQWLLRRIETTLQPDEYYCFRQHFLEGVDYKELAAQFGATPDSIRMRLNRGLAKVRELLPNWEQWLES
jgi:RNA polymerase sigma factor (sigma-70 family)